MDDGTGGVVGGVGVGESFSVLCRPGFLVLLKEYSAEGDPQITVTDSYPSLTLKLC